MELWKKQKTKNKIIERRNIDTNIKGKTFCLSVGETQKKKQLKKKHKYETHNRQKNPLTCGLLLLRKHTHTKERYKTKKRKDILSGSPTNFILPA